MSYRTLRTGLAVALAVASLKPAPLAADAPNGTRAHRSVDVALPPSGTLGGQLVDHAGRPITHGNVWLVDGRRKPIAAVTDAQGVYAFPKVSGGVYSLHAGDALQVCRVWPATAAPPKALSGVLLVANQDAVRAQHSAPPLVNGMVQGAKQFFASPAGMVAVGAAIATPIAIAATDDDPAL